MLLSFVVIWARSTYPRLREDQLQSFAWIRLVPVSLVLLLVVGFLKVYEVGIQMPALKGSGSSRGSASPSRR